MELPKGKLLVPRASSSPINQTEIPKDSSLRSYRSSPIVLSDDSSEEEAPNENTCEDNFITLPEIQDNDLQSVQSGFSRLSMDPDNESNQNRARSVSDNSVLDLDLDEVLSQMTQHEREDFLDAVYHDIQAKHDDITQEGRSVATESHTNAVP